MGKGSLRASRSTKQKKPNIIALVKRYGEECVSAAWAANFLTVPQADFHRARRDATLREIRAALKAGGQ